MKIRILLGVVMLILAGAALTLYYPPARLWAKVLTGRSPDCPPANALQSAENLQRQIRLKDEMLRASRRLETDAEGYQLWETPRGRYWIPRDNQWVLPYNLAEMERDIYSSAHVRIRPGDVVLDCGANVGTYTRLALDRGASVVVAIEPARENLECLRRNFAAEIAQGKVILYPKGVWDKEEELTLNVDPQNSAADSFVIQREGALPVARIPVTTIDKLVTELQLPQVDFIKMDIEGAEPNALRGAAGVIARHHPRLAISVYHAPDHPRTVPALVRAAWSGYQMDCGPCAEAGWLIRPDVFLFY